MTYPKVEVITFLSRNFECLKINVQAPGDPEKQFMRAHRLLWSPGFIFTDCRGNEVRQLVGFRQPDELMAEAAIALGKVSLLHSNPDEAYDWFQRAYDLSSDYETAPESLFWLGIANFRASRGDKENLWPIWERLMKEYPESRWATSADCRAYVPRAQSPARAGA